MFSKRTLMPLRGYMYFVKYVAGSALIPSVRRMMFFRFSFATRCACFEEICDVGRPHTRAEYSPKQRSYSVRPRFRTPHSSNECSFRGGASDDFNVAIR